MPKENKKDRVPKATTKGKKKDAEPEQQKVSRYRPDLKITSFTGSEVKQILDSVPFDKVYEYVEKQYRELGLLPNLPYKTNYIDGMTKRLMCVLTLKTYYEIDSLSPNLVTFKIHDLTTKKEANYGFLFAFDFNSIPEGIKKAIYFRKYEYVFRNYAFMHFSFSHSMVSSDGEYRSRLIRWNDLMKAKNSFLNLWDDLTDYIISVIEPRGWTIYTNTFSTSAVKSGLPILNNELDQIIKTEVFPTLFLSATWFLTIYNHIIGLTEAHMNSDFYDIMFANLNEDIKFIKTLSEKYGDEYLEKFRIALTVLPDPLFIADKTRFLTVGFKMIPLNVNESKNPFDIRYKPWRELHINNAISDLVINKITPGLPFHGSYYYVRNTRKGLYDNKSQYNRIKNSELAKDIVKDLMNAQRGAMFAMDIGRMEKYAIDLINLNDPDETNEDLEGTTITTLNGSLPPNEKNNTEQKSPYINTKFRALGEKISQPIEYATDEIIMSDTSLILVSEHVGRTVGDTIKLLEKNHQLNVMMGHPLSDGGYQYFAKYIFEILYTLLAVNKHFGIIHGDLHLNNATIGFLHQKAPENSFVTYQLNKDINSMFVFPENSYYGCVIDFSRAIIHNDYYENLRNKSFPPAAKLSADMKKLADYDKGILTNIYNQHFKDSQNSPDMIRNLVKSNFDGFFRLMTLIDVFMFCTRLSLVITKSRKASTLISDLAKESMSMLIEGTSALIRGENERHDEVSTEWPIESLLKKYFAEFNDRKKLNGSSRIIDSYVLDNPIHFSTAKSTMLPDGIKNVKYEKEAGKIFTVQEITEFRELSGRSRDKVIEENYEKIVALSKKESENIFE